MKRYLIWDEGAEKALEADDMTAAEAMAEKWLRGGDWGDVETTEWVSAWLTEVDADDEEIDAANRVRVTVAIDPPEPECDEGCDHEWASPYEIFGGCKENPGVCGHGGGVVIHEVCLHCGTERITDTWAPNPENGQEGLTSVRYEAGKYADRIEHHAGE